MTLVFYDTEATGPDPLDDQILSIAAVVTDDSLAVLDSVSLCCRLRPHQLVTAEALLLTGLSMAEITDPSRPSLGEMMRDLSRRLRAWAPAVRAGYSILEFDEPLLAASLRPDHLAPAARLDLQRLVLGLHEFAPGAVALSRRFDGQPSFRLADVARANAIRPGRAHDAMGDVTTTLALARLVKAKAPDWWSHMCGMGEPAEAAAYALAEPVRLYTEFHHNRPHHWLVAPIGPVGADVLGFDLAHDPEDGHGLPGAALDAWLRRRPHPLRLIRTGDCPFVLAREWAEGRLNLDQAEASGRAARLAADPAYRRRLLDAHARLMAAEGEISGDGALTADPEGLEAGTARRLLAGDAVPWMTLDKAFDAVDRATEGASDAELARLEGLLAYLRTELAWAEARARPQNRSKPNS